MNIAIWAPIQSQCILGEQYEEVAQKNDHNNNKEVQSFSSSNHFSPIRAKLPLLLFKNQICIRQTDRLRFKHCFEHHASHRCEE